jgi:hypothetical protein
MNIYGPGNCAVVAISSERPNSLRGMPDTKYSFASAGIFAMAFVAIGPGLSTFTRILHSASSHSPGSGKRGRLYYPSTSQSG